MTLGLPLRGLSGTMWPMPKFLLPFLTLLACLVAPLSAAPLELSDLHLPMTRSEADTALSKDYTYTVLEDMTVRRQWRLSNRVVSVDFSPKAGDKALLIYIDYRSPVADTVCDRDAAALLGGEVSEWKRLNSKRAQHLGLKKADGLKLEGGRYCFRELDAQERITRLAYFASKPEGVRWQLKAEEHDDGQTAMGSRADGSKGFLWKDEERRRGKAAVMASARAAAERSASRTTGRPAAAAAEDAAVEEPQMMARPEEEVSVFEKLRQLCAKVTPKQWGIAGGVILVLLLLHVIKQQREEKKREAIADYIMNRGQIPVDGKGKKRRR